MSVSSRMKFNDTENHSNSIAKSYRQFQNEYKKSNPFINSKHKNERKAEILNVYKHKRGANNIDSFQKNNSSYNFIQSNVFIHNDENLKSNNQQIKLPKLNYTRDLNTIKIMEKPSVNRFFQGQLLKNLLNRPILIKNIEKFPQLPSISISYRKNLLQTHPITHTRQNFSNSHNEMLDELREGKETKGEENFIINYRNKNRLKMATEIQKKSFYEESDRKINLEYIHLLKKNSNEKLNEILKTLECENKTLMNRYYYKKKHE